MSYEYNNLNMSNKVYVFQSGYDTSAGTNVGVNIAPTFSAAGTGGSTSFPGEWDANGKRTLMGTSAVANTAAVACLTSPGPKISAVRSFYTKLGTYTDVSSSRIWCIWTEINPNVVDWAQSSAPARAYVGFRYDTSVGDTTWKFIVGKSASVTGTQTIVDTGIPVTTNALYELAVEPSSETKFTGIVNGAKFSLNTGAGNGLSTSNTLFWYTGITTLSASQRSLRWYHQYLVCG